MLRDATRFKNKQVSKKDKSLSNPKTVNQTKNACTQMYLTKQHTPNTIVPLQSPG
jgi:hypothetical protein